MMSTVRTKGIASPVVVGFGGPPLFDVNEVELKPIWLDRRENVENEILSNVVDGRGQAAFS